MLIKFDLLVKLPNCLLCHANTITCWWCRGQVFLTNLRRLERVRCTLYSFIQQQLFDAYIWVWHWHWRQDHCLEQRVRNHEYEKNGYLDCYRSWGFLLLPNSVWALGGSTGLRWPWTHVPRWARARAPCHLSQCEESGGSHWGTAERQTSWYASCHCSHVMPANYIWQTYSLYSKGLHYYCMVGGSQISGQFVTWWRQWQWQTTQWARLQWPWHWSRNPRTISTLLPI